MLSSRSFLLQFLESADAATLKKYRLPENQPDTTSLRMRIFDRVPRLLPDQKIDEIGVVFRHICLNIKSVKKTDNGLRLGSDSDKKRIHTWLVSIIDTAVNELLDTNGCINPKIAALLHWDQNLTPSQTADIICAYVNAVNQAMVPDYIPQSSISFQAVWNYVNENYKNIVNQTLKKRGFAFTNLSVQTGLNSRSETSHGFAYQNKAPQELSRVFGIPIGGIVFFPSHQSSILVADHKSSHAISPVTNKT